MKANMTELVFILDRSGSMAHLTDDTIGGFNSFLEKQKQEPGECLVSAVLFNNATQVLYDRVPLAEVPPMTREEYRAGGNTALLDAIGRSTHHIGRLHKHMPSEEVPEHTVFVIITDGYENASCLYSRDEIKRRIEHQEEKYGWKFVFLGANMDAVREAGRIGIVQRRAASYMADREGMGELYCVVDKAVKDIRRRGEVEDDWADEVKKDVKDRG